LGSSRTIFLCGGTECPMPHRLPDYGHFRQSTVSLFGTRDLMLG